MVLNANIFYLKIQRKRNSLKINLRKILKSNRITGGLLKQMKTVGEIFFYFLRVAVGGEMRCGFYYDARASG